MSEQPVYLGQIQAFGFSFAPRGWAICAGQLLQISEHQALFSLLGTMYGGDGRTTFALPDLRGRAMVGTGQGAGLYPVSDGQQGGQTEVVKATNGDGIANNPFLGVTICIALEGEFPSRP